MPKYCVVQQLDKPGQIIDADHYEFYQDRLSFFRDDRKLITTFSGKGWLQIYEVMNCDEEISISRIRLIEENNTVIYNWIKDCVKELDSYTPVINNTLFSSMIPVIRSAVGIKKHSDNFHKVFELKGVTIHVYSKSVEIVKNG